MNKCHHKFMSFKYNIMIQNNDKQLYTIKYLLFLIKNKSFTSS